MRNGAVAAEGLSAFLPGRIVIGRGSVADYRELAHFHYAPGRPATWAGVWRAVYICGLLNVDCGLLKDRGGLQRSTFHNQRATFHTQQSTFHNQQSARVIAVGVLSYPTPAHRVRDRVLGLGGPRYGHKLRFINLHVRTISRVIVHPQFRGLGIASALVRRICEDCPTRYVEAIAAMGEVHPLFEKAGMRKVGEGYFLLDRRAIEGKKKASTSSSKSQTNLKEDNGKVEI